MLKIIFQIKKISNTKIVLLLGKLQDHLSENLHEYSSDLIDLFIIQKFDTKKSYIRDYRKSKYAVLFNYHFDEFNELFTSNFDSNLSLRNYSGKITKKNYSEKIIKNISLGQKNGKRIGFYNNVLKFREIYLDDKMEGKQIYYNYTEFYRYIHFVNNIANYDICKEPYNYNGKTYYVCNLVNGKMTKTKTIMFDIKGNINKIIKYNYDFIIFDINRKLISLSKYNSSNFEFAYVKIKLKI